MAVEIVIKPKQIKSIPNQKYNFFMCNRGFLLCLSFGAGKPKKEWDIRFGFKKGSVSSSSKSCYLHYQKFQDHTATKIGYA